MSINGLSSDPHNIFINGSSHKRNDSGELDVFEAAKYFSGYAEPTENNYTAYTQKHRNNRREEIQGRRLGGRTISLDLSTQTSNPIHQNPVLYNHDVMNMKKNDVIFVREKVVNVKHKQPSSPGWRIASFLNSLFNQAGSKKNKSKLKSMPHDEEESPGGWRRRRRSSIGHFLSSSKTTSTNTTTNSSSKSLYSSSGSGFRTPSPCINTPRKNYKGFLNYSDQKQVISMDDHKRGKDLSWLDEKLKFIETLSEKQRVWADGDHRKHVVDKAKHSRKFNCENVDAGAESDSSSDLFELQNYDLSFGGLPVYETTNAEGVKKTAPIYNRPI